MDSLYLLFICLVVFSALYSGSETAFLSSSKVKAHIWKRQKKRFSSILFAYRKEPERYLITILVGNNFVNIAYTSIGTILLVQFFPEKYVVIILTSILLIFGEILPKTFFSVFADKFILFLTPLVRALEVLFFIPIKITEFISARVLSSSKKSSTLFTRRDVHSLFAKTDFSSDLNTEQRTYFQNVFKLQTTPVKDLMVPRIDMIAIDISTPIADVYKMFEEGGFSKLPVYDESIDNIVGLVFIYSLIKESPKTLEDVVEKALYVPENKKCSDLLYEFKKESKSIAIVIDEYGGTSGLITIQNLLKMIIGVFEVDEYQPPSVFRDVVRVNETTYRLSGRAKKEELTSLGLDFPDGDFETIAGLILSVLGDFPTINQTIRFPSFRLTIISLTRKRIQWVKLELLSEDEKN